MPEPIMTEEESKRVADKVRSGEYFREARHMYDIAVHDPMVERYFYVLITGIAAVILLIAVTALQGLYPLENRVPFIFSTQDIMEDVPSIESLVEKKGEGASEALLRFLVQNYVVLREEYDNHTFDRNANGINSQSNDAVFNEYKRLSDPRNPESPIRLYESHSKRRVTIVSVKRLLDQPIGMEILFEAEVIGRGDIKKSRWQADIGFDYSGIALDENSGKVMPPEFKVTQYRSKRLQDSR